MLHTVTLNPAWDITYRVGKLHPGLHRAKTAEGRAGGKGINVSRAIAKAGGTSAALAVLGGSTGKRIAEAVEKEKLPLVPLWTEGETRTNISVMSDTGESMEINGPGCPMNRECTENLAAYLAQNLRYGDILCLCGSLPAVPSVSGSLYTHLCMGADMAGARVVLDCSGEALRAAVRCPCPPMLIKPNLPELAELAGMSGEWEEPTVEEIRKAAESAVDIEKTAVLCTLGKEGAVWMDSERAVFVPAVPLEKAVCEKGAGDTYLGTFLWYRFGCEETVESSMEKAAKAAAALVAGK